LSDKSVVEVAFHEEVSLVVYTFLVPLIRGEQFSNILPVLPQCIWNLTWQEGWPLVREVTSFEGNNLVVSYYFSAFEVWPDKKGGLIREGTTTSKCKH
jgi:hypothetical protein